MKTLLLEVRDRGTFIAVIATKTVPENMEQQWLLARAGFGRNIETSSRYVLFTRLEGGETHYDAFNWGNRTMHTAHDYVIQYFDELKDGDVIDVEYILGETSTKKQSERY